ncbi:ead/Ea22-like family protein [Klebsiella pneumoniae]|uniref:ead/Ea22-like family protein n=1 Tax=Klebsiella pneumoniae TaxID=573 RepID=UPI00374F6D33
MTTDITELAQSLKAAAEKAIGANERLSVYKNDEIIDISQHEGEQIDIDIADINLFLGEANPANILTLVEALEKAQQRIAEMDAELEREREKSRRVMSRIAELESRTVKLPHRNLGHDKLFLLCPFPYYDAEDMEKALAAAGIKVEVE